MSAPDLTGREIAAAVRVLRSGRLSLGPTIPAFEKAFAKYVGARHAVAVSSGTAALHLALVAAGVAEGDFVITSPFSFVASANCILFRRATPIFVDVDLATANLDVRRVEQALDDLATGKRGPLPPRLRRGRREARVKAVLPVHVFGRPIDMTSLMAVARARDLVVIEDACEAVGAEWNGRRVGTFGEMGCFGFYPNKPMTTGEGGMIVTGDEAAAMLCRSLRNQGRDDADPSRFARLGYNYRLSEMAAAIGTVQVARLGAIQTKRARVVRWYEERLANVAGITCPEPLPSCARASWFTFVVHFEDSLAREIAIGRLRSAGIPSRVYFPTIPLQPIYVERFGYRPGEFPNAERLSQTCLALPFSSRMSEGSVDRVCAALRSALRRRAAKVVGSPSPHVG